MSDKRIPITGSVGYQIVQWKSQNLSKTAEKTSTQNAPKLETGPKISNFRKAIINFKAALSSIPPGKKFAEIKQSMVEKYKAEKPLVLDRRDAELKKNNVMIKGYKTETPLFELLGDPTLVDDGKGGKKAAKDPKFPFAFSSTSFYPNARVLLSTFLDQYISDARSIDRGMGPDEIRSRIRESFAIICPFASTPEVTNFDAEALKKVVQEFRSGGRDLKADILQDFIGEFTKAHSSEAVEKRLDKKVVQDVREEVAKVVSSPIQGEKFLRGSEGNNLSALLFTYGGSEVLKKVSLGVDGLVKQNALSDVKGMDLGKPFTKTQFEATVKCAMKMLETFAELPPQQKVKDKLAELLPEITSKKGSLPDNYSDILVHRFFNNSVILRNVSPALTTTTNPNHTPHAKDLMAISKLLTNVTNNVGSGAIKDPEMQKLYGELCKPLHEKVNTILLSYGLPQASADIPFKP